MNKPIFNDIPVKVTRIEQIQIECPNSKCQYQFNVKNTDWGVIMTCPECKNQSYNPNYNKNMYTLKQMLTTGIGGVFVGLIANTIFQALIFKIVSK